MKELFADPLFLTAVGSIANSSFFCVVFAVASNIALRDLLQEVKKPALLLRAFGVISVIVPLLTAGVVKLLDVPLLVGGVILLGAVTAGSPLAFWERRWSSCSCPQPSLFGYGFTAGGSRCTYRSPSRSSWRRSRPWR